jgi:L-rhamnose isomerase/sugar isomerase
VDDSEVIEEVKKLKIETPSWGYGDSGTRFKTFSWPGAARNIWEKIDDAALVNELTGAAPRVALHIPWDIVDDFAELRGYAGERGLKIGAINPNVFQDEEYRIGSVCNPDPAIRRRAIDHMLQCAEICGETGADILSLWFADGSNYFGQDDLVRRKHNMIESLGEVYEALPRGVRMLIEYKFYEPAFYHTDIPDWGTSHLLAQKLGSRAQVLIDTGHHPLATNVEQIVAYLVDEGILGGFHFNSRNYGDDDLIVGASDPFQLFKIFHEIVSAERSSGEVRSSCANNIAYMVDQSHAIEGKIEPMILSIINCQIARAKALLVDADELRELQLKGDVLGAHELVQRAFQIDVAPLVSKMRKDQGIPENPIRTFREGGYADKLARERKGGESSGSGYPT